MEHHPRILLVTIPGQGHINPCLQFAKRLVRLGATVTFVTAISAVNRMNKTATSTPDGLTLVGFSDGYDGGWNNTHDMEQLLSDFKRCGTEAVAKLITSATDKGQPFARVVYSILLPWVGKVARDLRVPSTFLWIQPAAILDIYYYYFNGYGDVIKQNCNDPSWSIELPGLPPFTIRDLPSFLFVPNINFSLQLLKEHVELLGEEINQKVLVNSFDGLEFEALRAIKEINLVGVGPLIPSAFLDGKEPSDTSFGGDLFQKSSDYIEWLDSKPESSVVYVAFGSFSELSKKQLEEMAHGLIESHMPFLWVIRPKNNGEEPDYKLSRMEELEQQGMIVPWCSQVEVLSHPSLGCFVTHCGWNSTLESLASGVPVVGFPQWTDQGTNAKLIEDVWRTGVRVTTNEEGIVEGDEIKRCIQVVMGGGERGAEMKRNANKWKDLAREAAKEGGLSDLNLRTFVDEVRAASVN